jgi:hypothetical protein
MVFACLAHTINSQTGCLTFAVAGYSGAGATNSFFVSSSYDISVILASDILCNFDLGRPHQVG